MTKYYIQETRQYVGNSVLWWRPDSNGYTCNIDEAGIYDEEKAISIERNRDTDKKWPVDMVQKAIGRHVDIQKLRAVRDSK